MEKCTKLIVIIGPNGVGKSSAAKSLMTLISEGREENRIKRAIDNTFYFYDRYDYPTIDTTELEIDQVADRIAEVAGIDRM